jgi:transposase
MSGFICGVDRGQGTMFPAQLEDYVAGDNPVRVIGFFVDQLDLRELGFSTVDPKETGRPAYHPAVMLKIYVYGYINRVQSSRRLERECQRNVEAMWLTGCLAPDFKTIADFRKDNGAAIRKVCREFIVVCGRAGVLTATAVRRASSGICLSLKSLTGSPRPRKSNARISKTRSAGSSKKSSA